MGRFKNLEGIRFGKLVVTEYSGSSLWQCKCDCGSFVTVRGSNLTSGHTVSCGCLRRDMHRGAFITHGQSGSRLYSIWCSMKTRCYNPKHVKFKHYGGRGITVYSEWVQDFEAFQDWSLSHGYRDELTIDRINVNGNYDPKNCRWATWSEQNKNRRTTNKGGVL